MAKNGFKFELSKIDNLLKTVIGNKLTRSNASATRNVQVLSPAPDKRRAAAAELLLRRLRRFHVSKF